MPFSRRMFLVADHGLAIVYFLQSDVVTTLLDAGVEVILVTDDGLKERIQEQFGRPGLIVQGLRLREARQYAATVSPEIQWWLAFLRRVGSSNRINTEAMDSYVDQVSVEEPNRRRLLMPLARVIIALLRRSRSVRAVLRFSQRRFVGHLYKDLLDSYRPDLVVASTPGWRLDRYLMREAARRGIRTAAVVVGWDNPSSYSLSGAPVRDIICWSDIQKEELVLGADWDPQRVHLGGMPIYDGYFRKTWHLPRADYFKLHNLNPNRKLLAYACSFVSFSPNLQNVQALARLVASDVLPEPSQLLIRLHPNHFLDVHLFAREREAIYQLAREVPAVHVVEPVPLGGELGYYSGEDMPEKASMLAHSDVFVTVYSTMVVEAAIHDRPIISLCLDTLGGWNTDRKYSLPLSKIGNWPTHNRFRDAGAGRVAMNPDELRESVKAYLANPSLDRKERGRFVLQEVSYTDGSAGRRTGDLLQEFVLGG